MSGEGALVPLPRFVFGGHMYWDEFAQILRRNATPSAQLKFEIHRTGRNGTVSIVDGDLPRREGLIPYEHTENDWWQQSFVCNAAWVNGEIPLDSVILDENDVHKMFRGARTTVKLMLGHGSLRPSMELDTLLGESSSKSAQNWTRFMYAA